MGNDKKIELLAGDEIYVNGKWFWDVIKADQEYVTVKMYYNKEYPGISTPNSSNIKIPRDAFSVFSENNGIKYCLIGETTLKKLTGGLFRLLKVQQDISELMENASHTGIITSLTEFRRINDNLENTAYGKPNSYIGDINELRKQLELPFEKGNGQTDKPAHVHFLDLIEDCKLKNISSFYSVSDARDEIEKAVNSIGIEGLDFDQRTLIYQVYYDLDLLDNLDLLSDEARDNDLSGQDEIVEVIYDLGLDAFSEKGKQELKNKVFSIIYNMVEENGLTNTDSDEDGLIEIWRLIDIGKTKNKQDLYKELKSEYKKRFGIYWTYDKNYAEAYWSNGGDTKVLMHGKVRTNDVNWLETVKLNYGDLDQEHELRLKDKVPFQLLDITFDNKSVIEFEDTFLST